jgi:DMSO/TMAO reductase YedYZ molybdopterin-dependent catalytic subunit
MSVSRRKAIGISGATLAGLSMATFAPAQTPAAPPAPVAAAPPAAPWPDSLVERPLRQGFPAPLPLNADGSAPEHPDSAAGPITDPLMWRTANRQAPEIEFDYRKMAIKVDTRGLARLGGTLRFSDLEKLPRLSKTFFLQCGAANPRGTVKWTGVRFSDFAAMLSLVPGVHYARFIASDRHYVDESMDTLMHPQVMLVWLMNDAPIAPRHGAPLRLIVPFRYGNRSIKAITEIVFGTPSLPAPPTPA